MGNLDCKKIVVTHRGAITVGSHSQQYFMINHLILKLLVDFNVLIELLKIGATVLSL